MVKSSDEGDDAQHAFDLSIGVHWEHLTPEAWPLTAFLHACFCDLFTWDIKKIRYESQCMQINKCCFLKRLIRRYEHVRIKNK